MESTFIITSNDKGFIIRLKEEANIIMNNYIGDDKFDYYKSQFETAIRIARVLEDAEPAYDEDIIKPIEYINNIIHGLPLSNITFNDDEFYDFECHGVYCNKRYNGIYKSKLNSKDIYNNFAFNCIITKEYNHNILSEISNSYTKPLIGNRTIYIAKGGIITGEFIGECKFKQEFIDKHSFNPTNIINIPVSAINDYNTTIYVVDCRHHSLKELSEIYDYKILKNEDITKKKYNIRRYAKFIKSIKSTSKD